MNRFLQLIAITAFSTSAAIAEPLTTIHDENGNSRLTQYGWGPITSALTDSSGSARQPSIYLYRNSNDAICDHANVYEADTGTWIANGPVSSVDIRTSTLRVDIEIPEEFLTVNKMVSVGCTEQNGTRYEVNHRLPAVPSIQWDSELTATGDWIPPQQPCERVMCHPGFGHYESLQYSAALAVVNHSNEGSCQLDYQHGAQIPLFHGKNNRDNFHSDIFITNLPIDAYQPPVTVQKISCHNPAGSTFSVQVWEIVGGNIQLADDFTYIQ